MEHAPGASRAHVSLIVRGEPDVVLDGIVVREVRRGFVAVELPPLEDWLPALSWLPAEVRVRFDEAALYVGLRDELSRRFAAVAQSPMQQAPHDHRPPSRSMERPA